MISGLFTIILAIGTAGSPEIATKAEPASGYEDLFRKTSGWVGADGDYSIPLGKDRVLWLFSDTFIGEIKDGRRVGARMINNSVAIQSGKHVEFFYRKGEDGTPRSFIEPEGSPGYFWLFDGTRTSKGLYIFLMRVKSTGGGGAFGFRSVGASLAHIANPDDPPLDWEISQQELKCCRFEDKGSIIFGSALLEADGYIYIYGVDSLHTPDHRGAMVVARVPEDEFGNQEAWRFYSHGHWQEDPDRCEALCDGIASEYSVSYVPAIKQYAAVYTLGGIFGIIAIRLAPKPEGPWSEPITVYECPDAKWHKKTFSYAAKAHPELSGSPNELIITYATNSNEFNDLIEDARLYWPRFIRVTIGGKREISP